MVIRMASESRCRYTEHSSSLNHVAQERPHVQYHRKYQINHELSSYYK